MLCIRFKMHLRWRFHIVTSFSYLLSFWCGLGWVESSLGTDAFSWGGAISLPRLQHYRCSLCVAAGASRVALSLPHMLHCLCCLCCTAGCYMCNIGAATFVAYPSTGPCCSCCIVRGVAWGNFGVSVHDFDKRLGMMIFFYMFASDEVALWSGLKRWSDGMRGTFWKNEL